MTSDPLSIAYLSPSFHPQSSSLHRPFFFLKKARASDLLLPPVLSPSPFIF
jgi:hypothetical protein